VNDKIKLKRGTTSQWAAANPILLLGEPGIDTTENKVKYGDGVTAWIGLAFSGGGGGGGGGGANLSVTTTSTTIIVASDSGTDATLATASGSVAGIMTATQFTKLDGIATGATANSSDATLLARANHTGTQAWSTITSTPTTLAGYGISDSITAAAAAAAYQPLDSDLTSIAALTTTSFGRSLLTQADASATRTTIGAGTSSFDGAYSSLSGIPSTFTPASHVHAGADITTGTVDPARLGSGSSITTKFLRGDSTWQSISGGSQDFISGTFGFETYYGGGAAPTGLDITKVYYEAQKSWYWDLINEEWQAIFYAEAYINTWSASTGVRDFLTRNTADSSYVTFQSAQSLNSTQQAQARTNISAQKAITSGTAAPSGGVDGDIYLQYT